MNLCQAQRICNFRRQVLDDNTKPATSDLTELDELLHHRACHVDRYCESDTDIASSRRYDRGVYTDQSALRIDQRSALITRFDGSVRLNEVFVLLTTQSTAPECTNNSRRYRLPEAKRIADRNHEIPDLESI